MHQRQVIRNAIAAALVDATDAAGRVFTTQKIAYQMRSLPAISVYSLSETSTMDTAPRETDRTLEIAIECIVGAVSNIDDDMDAIAEQVEQAMNLDPWFGGACAESELIGTTIQSEEEGDRDLGLVTLTYSVLYRTNAFVEPTVPAEFVTAYTNYSLGNDVAVDDQAEDNITVQE